MTHNLARFDAAPYGVYRWVGEVPPGDTQPDNGRATMGAGQWPFGGAGTGPIIRQAEPRREVCILQTGTARYTGRW